MHKKLNIIFYGTPEFATGALDVLHKSPHNIVGVVTAPDKPAGRGRKIQESHVKQYAVSNNLKVLQPTNLKSPDFIEELKTLEADLQVVVAFRMLPQAVWSMPPLGTFNLHASLLPQYRGAAPINWAIINQEKSTGVTTFFIDDKIDTGAIIDQANIEMEERQELGSLYIKLMNLGAELSLKTVNRIAKDEVTTTIQKDALDLKEAPKLHAGNTTIDFNKSAAQVDALVRGLNPFPVAKALLFQNGEQMTVKIFKTNVIESDRSMPAGSIVIKEKQMLVACGQNWIEIIEIQLPNKKRMRVTDLLNGYSLSPDARFDKA